ncbi:hypothetical protein DRE_04755 [Drechslerella stenobrocha 248]|uniref:Peroxisomal membrane protein 4 n=1 Tax=Drechslerella stenobrocha 248 TaxID=1043628 RepID=W7I0H3_9PEZI|nr:hypothetical protein DRE_04755 [Drechslerella stenobrocha 248]
MSNSLEAVKTAIDAIILNPANHDVLALLKGLRNGVVYGTKVRFPHALVMIFLFRSGTFREKLLQVFKATRTHARNLGTFVLLYKAGMLLQRGLNKTESRYDSFVAGLLGGYYVFGRNGNSSVNQQICIYVFARVVLGLAKLSTQPGYAKSPVPMAWREGVGNNAWPVFASVSWAFVMYLFRWHPEVIQPSLRSSMTYLYVNSERWDGLRNLLWHNV